MNSILLNIQKQINEYRKHSSVGELNDTFHSFDDLYKHRSLLLALLCLRIPYSWKSRIHEDGTMFDGMFIVGFPTPTGIVTYHCDNEYWDLFKIPILPHAPHFDGYTDKDCLTRIEEFIKSSDTQLINSQNIDRIEQLVKDYIFPTFGEDSVGLSAFVGFYNM